jgi:hypothetical protein
MHFRLFSWWLQQAGVSRLNGRAGRGLAALVLGLAACSPTYNWRELRLEGANLQAMMPCKPERAQRSVPLGSASAVLHMHSCEAGGHTFAVAWADVGDPSRTADALLMLRRASLAALRVDPDRVAAPALQWKPTVAGASDAQGLQVQGTAPGKGAIQMKAVHFSSGHTVYQVALYGPALSEEPGSTFFEGLRLP